MAALSEIRRLRVWENAAARGKELLAGLQALQERFDVVGDVRGEGLMCAIELVSDQAKKTPAGKDVGIAVQRAAYNAGAMIRVSGNIIIFSPPLIIDATDISTILSAVEEGLEAA